MLETERESVQGCWEESRINNEKITVYTVMAVMHRYNNIIDTCIHVYNHVYTYMCTS